MRFKGLDLNLLVALDALLAERSVSAASERMFLSQPAMSGALNRLRDYFQDELLVLSGRRMMLTPRAEQLVGPVRAALVQIETTVAAPAAFDPALCGRRFVVEASDFISEVLITQVAQRLSIEAPGVSIEIRPRQHSAEGALEGGEVDLVITPDFYAAPNHPSELLFEEDHVVVGWRENSRLREGFGLDDFFEAGHVAVHFDKGRRSAFAENYLSTVGQIRRVEISVPSFTQVPRFLVGTQRIALLHRRLAAAFAHHYPLANVPAPFEIPPLREVMQHHRIRGADQALSWFRGLIADAALNTSGPPQL